MTERIHRLGENWGLNLVSQNFKWRGGLFKKARECQIGGRKNVLNQENKEN